MTRKEKMKNWYERNKETVWNVGAITVGCVAGVIGSKLIWDAGVKYGRKSDSLIGEEAELFIDNDIDGYVGLQINAKSRKTGEVLSSTRATWTKSDMKEIGESILKACADVADETIEKTEPDVTE